MLNKRLSWHKKTALTALIAAGFLTPFKTANAASANWTGAGTDALWATVANWSATPVPGAGDTATFNAAAGAGGATITTNSINLGTLVFDTGAAGYTIGGATAGTGTITFADGTTNIVTMNAGVTNNQLINANITLGTAIAGTSTISNASPTNTLTIAGNILGGTGGTAAAKALNFSGAGAITVSGNINKGGASVLNATSTATGLLTLSGTNVFNTLSLNGGAASILDIGAGTLTVANATAGSTGIQSTTGATINASGGGTIALTAADGDWGTANGTTLTINPRITGAFRYESYGGANNTGTTVLGNNTNSFTGGLLISSGTVSVATIGNTGLNSALGTGGTLTIGSGTNTTATLRYTGAGEQSNKTLAFPATTGGTGLDASGTGAIHFTGTGTITPGGGIKTITLTGTGIGRIDSVIANNSTTNLTSLSKTGAGTWVLGGLNTYTGTTSITGGGNLIFTRAQTATTGNVTWNNSGLTYAASSDAALNLGGTIAITGGANEVLGGTIGSTTTSARINVAGAATVTGTALKVNVYGLNSVTPAAGTYTLLQAASGLGTLAPTLGTVYNNTNFTVTGVAPSATAITATIATATPITAAYWNGGLSGATNVWAASNGSTDSNWVTTASGGATAVVPGAGADVTISATAPTVAPTATVLGANMTIKTLTIADTTNGLGLNNDGFALTITPAVASAGITMNSGVPTSTIGTSLVLGAAQTWTNNSTNALVSTGIVSGAFGITKAGTGPLTLAGMNTFTGGVTVSAASTLNINSPTALGTSAGTLNLNAAGITLDNTLGQPITMTGNNPITFAAAATSVTFAGSNGANSNLNMGTGAVTFGAGTTFTVSNAASTITMGGTVALGANTFTKTGPGTLTLNGVISGSKTVATNAISITGGTLAIGGVANTFTGDIAVDGATSVFQMTGNTFTTVSPYGTVSGGTTYKTISLTNGGTFRLSSGTFNDNQVGTTNIGAGVIFNIGTGGGVFDVASGAVLTIDDGSGTGTGTAASQIQGSGTITKTGLGIFQTDDSTSYAGNIIVAAGTLQPVNANAFGTGGNTTIQSGAQLNVNGVTMTNAEPVNLSGTGLAATPAGALTNTNATAATWVGPITIATGGATIGGGAGALTITSTINTAGNTLTLGQGAGRTTTNGVISGTGAVIVNGSNLGGDWADSAAHTYSGGTTLNAGSATVPGVNSAGPAGAPTNGAFGTGTLVLNGGSLRSGTGGPYTVGNTVTLSGDTPFMTNGAEKTLIFSGPVTITGGTRTLNSIAGTSIAGTTIDFAGAIGDGGNNFGLIKTGAGNIKLSATNTYTGGTTVNAGLLNVTGNLANSGAITVTSTGYLSLISNAANPINTSGALNIGTAGGTTILGFDLGTSSDSLTGAAAATTAGNVYFNINAVAGFGAGSYTLLSDPAGGLSGATYGLGALPGGFTYSLNSSSTAVTLNVTAGGPAATNFYWGAGNSSWSTNANWFSNATGTTPANAVPSMGSSVIFNTTTATGPTIAATLDAPYKIDSLTFNGNPTGVTAVSISSGNNVNNTLTLEPASPANGINVGVNNGTVTISAPVTMSSPQTWTVDGTTGTATSSLVVSGFITGPSTGSVNFNAANANPATITLSSTGNTYSGASSVGANMNVVGGAAGGFSANTAWTVSGTLTTGAFSQTTGSLVGGTGIVQNGSATGVTLTIGNDNLGTSGSPATFAGTLQNGSTGTLGLTKVGTGVQELTGTYNYTGATSVNGGILRLNGSPGTGTTAITVNSGGRVQFGNANAVNSTNSLSLAGTGIADLFGNSVSVGGTATGASTSLITNSSTSTSASTATTVGTPSGAGVFIDALNITGAQTANIAAQITDGATRKTQIIVNNANQSITNFNNTSNSFTGGVVLANNPTGTRMGIAAAITGTPFGTGPIIIGQTATDKATIWFNTATGITLTNPVVFNTGLGSDRYGIRTDVASTTMSGAITANSDAVFSGNSTTGALALTGQITGVGGLILDVSQTSTANSVLTVTLNNAGTANNYQGDTIVGRTNAVPAQNYSAVLQLGRANQIPNGSSAGNVILNNNNASRTGRLNLAGFSETINGLSGNGILDGLSGTPTLTLGDNNTSATFSGTIINTAGTLTLTKIGTGTQTLSGASTFTGPINVNGGLIAFATSPTSTGPLGNSTVVNLSSGGGISYTAAGFNALSRPVAIGAGGGTINVANSLGTLTTAAGSVTSTGGNLIKTGPGTLVIPGSTTLNAGAAGVQVSSGVLQAGFGTNGISTINVGATGNLALQNSVTEVLTLGGAGTNLTLASGANLGFELASSGNNDQIIYNTAAVTSGSNITLNFFELAGFGAGNYTLLTSSTTGGFTGVNFGLGSAPNGFNYSISNNGTTVSLITTAYIPTYWNNTQGSNSWATTVPGSNFTSDLAGTTDAGHAPLATETVIFNSTAVAGPSITTTLDGSRTVDSLQFIGGGSPAVTSVTINQGSGGTLTLKPASASGGINILAGGGNATITAPVTLDNALSPSQTWNVADLASTLDISGNVAFGANVSKTGAGALTLSGNNSGSGNITLTSGKLNINSATALGTGNLTISGGTTIDSTVAGVTVAGNLQTWNGDFTFTGTNSLNLGSGAVTLGNSLTLTASANTLTVGGAVGGAAAFTKDGAGAVILANNNTYTGATTVNAGTLVLGGNNASTGATTVNGGTLTVNGASATSGVTISGGTFNIGNAGALGAGTLTLNSGTIDNTSGSLVSAANPVAINGNFTFTGSNNLTFTNPALTTLTITPVVTVSANTLSLNAAYTGLNGITKTGAGTLTLAGNSTYTGNTTVSAGTLNITGSLTGNTTSTALAYGGTAGKTIVNVSGSFNGFITTGANVASSVAVLNQTAGSITIVPPNSQDQQYLANNGGYGMLNITGGTFNTARFDGVGASGTASTTAVMYVGGTGTLNQNIGDWFLPIRTNGVMSMTVAPGGTFIRQTATTAQFSLIGLNGNNTYGILNVAGGTVDTGTGGTGKGISIGGSGFTPGTGNIAFVNAAGGTLLLGANTATGSAGGTTSTFFNFAGATVKSTAAMTAVIPATTPNYTFTSTIFGPITNNNNANSAFNTQIGTTSNFTGGLPIDTNGFATTYSNVITGATGVGVTQANIGDMSSLAGNSGYIGAPMVTFGAPAAAGAVPASGYAVIDAATGKVTGIVITSPGTYASGETPTITLSGGGGSIAPFATTALSTANVSGGLTKLGAGTLTLSAANTYTGTTNVNVGTLSLGAAGTTGSLSLSSPINIASGATLQINRTNAVVQGTDFTSSATAGGGISGAGQIVVTGGTAGQQTTLNGTNTHSGGTVLLSTAGSGGAGPILVIASNGALGTGTLTLRGSGSGGADTVQINGTGLNISNPIIMDTTLGFRENISNAATSGANTLSSPITISGNTVQTLILANNSTTGLFTISGNITAAAGNNSVISLRGTGTTGASLLTGTVTLNSTLDNNVGGVWTIQPPTPGANSWTQTQFNSTTAQGVIKLGINNALPTVDVTWSAAALGTLDLNGFNQTVAGISGGATGSTTALVTNNAATDSTLTISGIVTSPKVFNGIIKDGTTNKVSLLINSPGSTQTLTGANTYTGSTTISGGTLVLSTATNRLAATSAITVNGGTLDLGTFGQTTSANVSFASGTTSNGTLTKSGTNYDGQGGTVSAVLAGGVGLDKTTAGTLTLTGTNLYTGSTTVSVGKLAIGTTATPTGSINASALTINGATANLAYNSATNYTNTLTFTQGTLSGTNWNGSLSGLTIDTNKTIAPGNSAGTATSVAQTWANGGTYQWEINNATGTKGGDPGWDWVNFSGGLTQTAASGGFKIDITGLNASNVPGSVSNWNPSVNSTYIIASAATGITGFDATGFTINPGNFTNNNTSNGTWSIFQGNGTNGGTANDILLGYTVTASTTGTTYTLAAAPGTLSILKGGNLSATSTITNTGLTANNADTLTFTNLTGSSNDTAKATVTGSSNGGPLANGGGSAVQNLNIKGIANGNVTITSGVTTAKNTSSNTDATLSGTAGTINVVVGNASFDGTNSSTTFGAPLSTLVAGATNYDNSTGPLTAGWESNSINATVTGGGPAKVGTTATIVRYDNSSGGAETVSMAWRSRTATEADLVNNPKALLSDVVRITGMGPANTNVGTFVLEMTYDLDQTPFSGLNETAIAISGELQLGWFNPNTNQWVNAIAGNIGGATPGSPVLRAPTGSDPLGTWGIDTSAANGKGYVWAVLNHNSDFAVIPEPSTFVLGGLALLGFAGIGLRRRRSTKPQA